MVYGLWPILECCIFYFCTCIYAYTLTCLEYSEYSDFTMYLSDE